MYDKYFIVNSVSDAIELKNKYLEKSRIISGGTDLILEMEKGIHKDIQVIIDISRIADLDKIEIDDQKSIHIGSLATHSYCLKSDIIRQFATCLHQACSQVGSPQIRNRGTVVGNIVTASPANDTISALIALQARVKIQSIEGDRIVNLENFFTGVRKTVLNPNEMVTEIIFTALEKNEHSHFLKNALRNAQAISVLNVSVVVQVEQESIKSARIALGSVSPTVIRANESEQYLINKHPNEVVFNRAGDIAAKCAKPISDIRASDDYRREMVSVHVKRALVEAVKKQNDDRRSFVTLWGKEKTANKPLLENTIEINPKSKLEIIVNGKDYLIENAFHKNLLDLLRENILLSGTKEGCGEGECGACTVYMDGVAVLACLIPAPRAHRCSITTIEGVSKEDKLHKVQQSFIEEGAVQCGYCTPGFVMSSVKLLEEISHPTIDQIKEGISGNLCRCTGYYKIVKAIEMAAKD